MDDYSLWWGLAGFFLLLALVGGALASYRTKPGHRVVGESLIVLCLIISIVNFVGSFMLPEDEMGWGFIVTIAHSLLMFLFGLVGWIIRRSRSEEHRYPQR